MALDPTVSGDSGFSLVEIMVVVVLLGLVALLVYVGARGAVRIGETGKRKAEAVAAMKAAAEDLSGKIPDLAWSIGTGECDYTGAVSVPLGYEVKYTLSDTGLGIWRLELRVVRGGDTMASDVLLLETPGS
jgi:prepilin-type N-terminal cleavage/methylation domain-containing protein